MTRHPGIVIRALTWNLFHGRDRPPDAALRTWRSKWLRVTETNETHAQVNHSLRDEFAAAIAEQAWDVLLLQEAPPRWLRPLCRAAGADGASALTSRNFGAALRALVADFNPDLIASNEGGSNQILARPPWEIEEVRRLTLTFFPERRRLIWVRVRGPGGRRLAVANLHGTVTAVPGGPARDAELAAERAVAWADGLPLIFGGDLNLRPAEQPEAFTTLRERFGLAPPTGPRVLDHLLARGLDVVEAPRQLPPSVRDRPRPDGKLVRLSDHEIVVAALGMK